MSATTEQSYLQATRTSRIDALMWVAEHAALLGDAYSVSTTNTYHEGQDMGDVRVQGERGALRSLIRRFSAVRSDREREDYLEWFVVIDGVKVTFIEEVKSR